MVINCWSILFLIEGHEKFLDNQLSNIEKNIFEIFLWIKKNF